MPFAAAGEPVTAACVNASRPKKEESTAGCYFKQKKDAPAHLQLQHVQYAICIRTLQKAFFSATVSATTSRALSGGANGVQG